MASFGALREGSDLLSTYGTSGRFGVLDDTRSRLVDIREEMEGVPLLHRYRDVIERELSEQGIDVNVRISRAPNAPGGRLRLDFSGLSLTWADFSFLSMLSDNSEMYDVLEYADFSGAILTNAKLVFVNLNRADFFGAILKEANLNNSSAQWAEFSEANLEWARLQGTDFANASLRTAKLSKDYLNWANFYATNKDGMSIDGVMYSFERGNLYQLPGTLEGFGAISENTLSGYE